MRRYRLNELNHTSYYAVSSLVASVTPRFAAKIYGRRQ